MRPKQRRLVEFTNYLMDKLFQHLSKFWPILDTMNPPYYGIGKFLTSLLNPLVQKNDYVVKVYFKAASKINSISFDDTVTNILLYLLTSSLCLQPSR